jgi:hypothetical protein
LEYIHELLKALQIVQGWPENGSRETAGPNLIICLKLIGTVVLYTGSMDGCLWGSWKETHPSNCLGRQLGSMLWGNWYILPL